MKRTILLAATLLILAGCSVMKPTEREITTLFLDYRPYAEQGFFLSSDPYPEEFTSLGEIQIEVLPAMIPKGKIAIRNNKNIQMALTIPLGFHNLFLKIFRALTYLI